MLEHTPRFPTAEATAWVGRAFIVGYMRALIQAVFRQTPGSHAVSAMSGDPQRTVAHPSSAAGVSRSPP